MKKLLIPMSLLFLCIGNAYAQDSKTKIKEVLDEGNLSLKDIVLNPENSDANYLSSEEEADFQYLSIREQIKLQEEFNKEEEAETEITTTGDISYKIAKTDKSIVLSPTSGNAPEILIYLKKDKMKIGEKVLKFDGELEATDSENIFNSPWKGLRWKKDNSKLVIGKLEKDGRVFIHMDNLASGETRDRILVE